ncbi:MAG: hypothetical protein P9M14_07550 [Candidatus Alcyoniella australis]|nr:hypothetical protein [Candidatus Alcyoniella australis]
MAHVAWTRMVWLAALLILVLVVCGCEGNDDDDDAGDDDVAGDDDAAGDDDSGDDDDQGDPFYPPDQLGPYAVGVTTMCFVDESRYEIWGNRKRLVPLEIWYPSTGAGGRPNLMPEMIGMMPEAVWGIMELLYGDNFEPLMAYVTDALREAEIQVAAEPWPVIFFSHGLNAVRFQNFTMCEYLASHGFIVAAPDHYGNAIFTNDPFSEDVILVNPTTVVTSFIDTVTDIGFVYDRLAELNVEPGGRFEGLLDLSRCGMTGHSYGGMTTLNAAPQYDFIDAIAPLNPAYVGVFPEDFDKPFFLVQGRKDGVVGFFVPDVEILWNENESTQKIYLDMYRAGHYSVTDACLLLPPGMIPDSATGCSGDEFIDGELANALNAAYLTAFFKTTIADEQGYVDYMLTNHAPEEIDLKLIWQ